MAHWRLVIASSDQEECNDITGDEMFTVGLSASGEEPVTHYWCGIIQERKDEFVPLFSGISSLQLFSYDDYTGQQTLDDIGMKITNKGNPHA